MEEAQPRQYPRYVRTIRRSKRKLSIVSRWYLRLAIITFIILVGLFLVSLFDKGLMSSFKRAARLSHIYGHSLVLFPYQQGELSGICKF